MFSCSHISDRNTLFGRTRNNMEINEHSTYGLASFPLRFLVLSNWWFRLQSFHQHYWNVQYSTEYILKRLSLVRECVMFLNVVCSFKLYMGLLLNKMVNCTQSRLRAESTLWKPKSGTNTRLEIVQTLMSF